MYSNAFCLIGLQIEWHYVFSLEFNFVISEEISHITRLFFPLVLVPWQVLYYETHLSTKQVAPHLHQIDGCSSGASTPGIPDVFLHQTGKSWRKKSRHMIIGQNVFNLMIYDIQHIWHWTLNFNPAFCARKYYSVMKLQPVWAQRIKQDILDMFVETASNSNTQSMNITDDCVTLLLW